MQPDERVCADYSDFLAGYAAGVLSVPRQHEIEQHLAQCERCTAELSQWQRLGAVVRDDADPMPRPSFAEAWSQLKQRLSQQLSADSSKQDRQPQLREVELDDFESIFEIPNYHSQYPPNVVPLRPGSRFRRVITTAVACGAVLLLVVGAVVAFERPNFVGGMPHGGGSVLNWQKISLPAGVTLDSLGVEENAPNAQPGEQHAWLTIVPQNGNIAYICQTLPGNTTHLWRTVDAGEQWTALPTISTQSSLPICSLQTDENDPQTVFVTLTDQLGDSSLGGSSFVLRDSSLHWQPASSFIQEVASWQGTFYAIKGSADNGTHLYASTNLKSWREIDSNEWIQPEPGHDSGYVPTQLWVQSTTGALLVWVNGNLNAPSSLWTSSDQGRHWQHIAYPWSAAPSISSEPTLVYVEPVMDSQPFHICAVALNSQNNNIPQSRTSEIFDFYCSQDGGQTWKARFTRVSWAKGADAIFLFSGYGGSDAMLADGSVIAWEVTTIYRVPVDASSLTAESEVGTIPPPPNPNNIPGGIVGLTTRGAILWQPFSTQEIYVATYTP